MGDDPLETFQQQFNNTWGWPHFLRGAVPYRNIEQALLPMDWGIGKGGYWARLESLGASPTNSLTKVRLIKRIEFKQCQLPTVSLAYKALAYTVMKFKS